MVKQSRLGLILPLAALLAGCASPDKRLAKHAREFVYTSLSFSPSAATAAGLHQYNGQNLDGLMDDFGPQSIDQQRHFYEKFQDRLEKDCPPSQLSPENRADYEILEDQVSLALLDLLHIKSYLYNPTVYVETIGNALFSPYVLEYAPKAQRYRSIIARLQKLPLFVDQAKATLAASPAIWTQVAQQENEGNIKLVDETMRRDVPPELHDAYYHAATPAVSALRDFQNYLRDKLSLRTDHGFRLGSDLYTRKFHFTMHTGMEADRALEQAERQVDTVRDRMMQLALPLHQRLYPSHKDHAEMIKPEQQNRVISEVLAKIAERHATPDTYMDEARQDLTEARQFVSSHHLLTLPASSNLQVIPTPEFMRGIYSVGGFNPAPALEPQLGAFYWITPIPTDWPAERIDSKLREYNFYKLKLLTIHEAMPGHYVQFEVANRIQPEYRRLLRALYGNTPYIEGWAQYITQTMLDQGFLDTSPEMRLTFLKEQLRVLANAILDIRMQMLEMTDQEAMDLMEKRTFQEHEEAAGKLQRAKLSAAQLPAYFVGWQGWEQVRDEYKKAKGGSFDLAAFHDAALREGPVPLPLLAPLLH